MSKVDPESTRANGGRPLVESPTQYNPDLEDASPGRQSLETSEGPRELAAPESDLPAIKSMMVPMACTFQAYGAYVVLQRFLMTELHADHKGSQDRQDLFTAATTFMHWGKLVSRVGHDVVFSCLTTRARVYVAMTLTLLGVMVPPVFVYAGGSTWLGWAFIHFGLLGVGVGIFESTFLSVISPLGKDTKAWAIMGAPLGLAVVDILCQILHSKHVFGMNPVYFYWYIVVTAPVGMAIFHVYAPRGTAASPQVNIVQSLRPSGPWILGVVPFLFTKLISSLVMENTPGWYKVFNNPNGVPLFSPTATNHIMDQDFFFVILYIFVMFGDAISRRVVYFVRTDTQKQNISWLALSVMCSVGGFMMEVPAIAILTFAAAFFAFWGNGMCYGISTKYIDRFVPHDHSRAIYSLWCMLGDLGGIMGAALVIFSKMILCSQPTGPYECVKTK